MKKFIKTIISIFLVILVILTGMVAMSTWRDFHSDFAYPKDEVYVTGVFKDYYSSRSTSTRLIIITKDGEQHFKGNISDELKRYLGKEVTILLSDNGRPFIIKATESGQVLEDNRYIVERIKKVKERGLRPFYVEIMFMIVLLFLVYLLRRK